MSRLPTPGADSNAWGDILNDFLEVEHNSDGTLKIRSDGSVAPLSSGKVPAANLGSGTASVSNFLRGDGTWAVPGGASNATASTPGVVQLAGDLGGVGTSATAPVITDGAITNSKIANGSVSTNKLAAGAVTSNEISDGTITNTDISASAAIARTKLDSSTTTSLGKADSAEQVANKGTASGYAPLDGSSKVPIANLPTGSSSTTVAIGNDSRFAGSGAGTAGASLSATDASVTNSRTPTGTAGGDLTGTYPSPTIISGVALSGVPTAATAAVDTNTTQIATTAFVVGQRAFVAPVAPGVQGVGSSFKYARADHVHPGGATIITSTNTTWPIPTGATLLEIIAVGGGGGGGGGGSALTSGGVATQVGGGGGGSGTFISQIVSVGSNTTLNVTIGAGGTSGSNGAANSNAGGSGGNGGLTQVTATGITISATGGAGGAGSGANSTTTTGGGAYGVQTSTVTSTTPGSGGYTNTGGGFNGGGIVGYSGGAGGGGSVANTTNGGVAGGVPTQTTYGSFNSSKTGSATGGTPSNSPSNTGCGGAGGGGGAPGGAGGSGAVGGSGYVIVKVIG